MITSTTSSRTSPLVVSTMAATDPSDFCMEWNAENALNRVLQNSIEQARFAYDLLRRRVEKVARGVTTSWTYDDESALREVRRATTLKYVRGPGIDEPLATDSVDLDLVSAVASAVALLEALVTQARIDRFQKARVPGIVRSTRTVRGCSRT